MRPYIPVKPAEFPEIIDYTFGNDLYSLGFNYDDKYDSFSVDLFDANGKSIIMGEPVVLNKPLWSEYTNLKIPSEQIIPMDESDQETEVTSDNLGSTVQFYLDILAVDKDGKPIPDEGDELIV